MLNSKYHLWHYKKFVNKNYKNQINKLYDFEFLEDLILIQNDSYETKLSTTQLEKIIELDTIIFLQLKDDLSLTLSKKKIDDLDQLQNFLNQLAKTLNIEYVHDEHWKWK